MEQPRNISQTLNKETPATTTTSKIIVVVPLVVVVEKTHPRRTCRSYARQEFDKIFSVTH